MLDERKIGKETVLNNAKMNKWVGSYIILTIKL